MRGTLLISATLVLAAFAGGCKARAHREPPAPAATRESPASRSVTISDAEIDSYIEWWRTDVAFVTKHLGEMGELQERLSRKYSPANIDKIQSDPDVLAMMERQREERMEHHRNKPISPEKAGGFDSVLAGLGRTVTRDGRTVYEVHHQERALRGARDKYGDPFVDKVLSRGDDIAAAMNP